MNASPPDHNQRPVNHLASEKSPYLQQHKHNPVDWYPWGEPAFQKARTENKPIFLSIGYSTCHWCHVMERETFENEGVGKVLNEHFISIKVDREERPDVDKIYMTFVQSTQGQGGWPLNVFLTPALKPFYGGTYFPPDNRMGRPAFTQVLEKIHDLWVTRKQEVEESSRDIHTRLEQSTAREIDSGRSLSRRVLELAAHRFKSGFDSRNGGFGGAPKFPRPSLPAFLLRQAVRSNDQAAVNMVLSTCDHMARGGICDQLGGGFARYSVDAGWLVPHFEKMLYDNAQLLNLYLDVYRVSGEKRFAQTARDILTYIARDMTHPEGGFYSAEDADSEGKEGKFYCWTLEEVKRLLKEDEARVAIRYFGITERGNFVDHSDPHPLANQNVLHIANPELTPAERDLLASAKGKLLKVRSRRIRPHLDDKILASWNGLMLGACARAYAVLGDPEHRKLAERNLGFIRSKLWDASTKTLHHRWRDGERDTVQLLEAYAFLAAGVLELYEATLVPETLSFAVELAEQMTRRFQDPKEGGFWQSAAGASDLILRMKEDYDGAEPSGNSVAATVLLRLATITGRSDFARSAEQTLKLFADRLHELPDAVPNLLLALDFWIDTPRRVVLAGTTDDPKTIQLLHAVHASYQPGKVVLGTTGLVEPFAKTIQVKSTPLAYICTGQSCQAPTDDPETIRKFLK